MAFDINEARQIIEDAKKRGLISTANSHSSPTGTASTKPSVKVPAKTTGSNAVIPDWLQKGIMDSATGEAPPSNDHLFSSRE